MKQVMRTVHPNVQYYRVDRDLNKFMDSTVKSFGVIWSITGTAIFLGYRAFKRIHELENKIEQLEKAVKIGESRK